MSVMNRQRKPPPSITSFFVYNLPSSIDNLQLKALFQHHKNLVDTFIPKKKDKYNNLFGFIRFRNIFNPQAFLPSLQKTKFEGLVLSVHLAKKDKSGHPSHLPQKPKPQNPNPPRNPNFHRYPNPTPPPPPPRSNFFHPSKTSSFKDKLLNNQSFSIPSVNLSNIVPENPNAWKESSIIAKSKDFDTLLISEGLFKDPMYSDDFSISYVGGLYLLLKFNTPTAMMEFMKSNVDFLKKWFSFYDIWNEQEIKPGKIIKADIFGFPLSFWDSNFINELASTVGTVLVGAVANPACENLSKASVTLLVESHKKIDNTIQVSHGSTSFYVRIVEVNSEWFPPLLTRPFAVSSDNENSDGSSDDNLSEYSSSDASMHDEPTSLGNDPSSISPKVATHHPLSDNTPLDNPTCPSNNSIHACFNSGTPIKPSLNVGHTPNQPNQLSPTIQNPLSPPMQNTSITPPITMQNPLITTPVFSRSKSSPSLILNPSLSRKRQRRRSPVIMDATSFDLNSPPPIPNRAQPNNPYEFNTAPAMHNKHTEFPSRYFPPPVSFESLLNKEFPPLLSTLNVPSPPPNPPQPPPTPYPLPIAEETLVSSLPPFEIELKETIMVGECIGIHLAGYEDKLAEILSETRANQSSQ